MKGRSDRTFQGVSHVILSVWSLLCILPVLLLLMSSLTSEKAILTDGYSFLPKEFSFAAYAYIIQEKAQIIHAYMITVAVTLVGTSIGIILTVTLAYVLSRKNLPGRKVLNLYVTITMLFNGGLVPTYLVYTQVFNIKNTFFALFVPTMLLNAFFVMITRTYITGNIPDAIVEAAEIDGCGPIKTFFSIVFPLMKPIIATIGLFIGIGYWNDWTNGLYYVTDANLFGIQNLLNKMIASAQFMSSNSSVALQLGQEALKIPTVTVRMAVAFIGVLPILVVYPFIQNFFVKGIALGAVKG